MIQDLNIETLYDGLISYIKTGIKDYLDEMDSKEITVPAYKAYHRNANADILNLKVYPALMLEYGRTEEEVQETGWDRVVMPISFYSVVSGGDTTKCQIMAERYIMALRKLFSQDRTCGGLTEKVILNGWEFLPVLNKGQGCVIASILNINFGLYLPR